MLDGSGMIENQLKIASASKIFASGGACGGLCLRLRRAIRAAPGKKLR